MIHAPEDVMCYAIQGTKPLWKNANVTVRDFRARSVQTQPMPYMCPCQETQGRYGAVEATQKV